MILRDLINLINNNEINVELVKETKPGNSYTEWFFSNNGVLVHFWGDYKVTSFEEIPNIFDGGKGHIKIKVQWADAEMETKRKKVFICSPYRGDVKENIKKAAAYCHMACRGGYMPIAPHLFIPQFLDDDVEAERALGISMGLDLLQLCEEMWVFGNPTEGMAAEISFANKHGKKIIYMDEIIYLEDNKKTMTIKQAQEIVEKQGFAWTVTEIIETEQLYGIICEYNKNVSHMIYSKAAEKIISIGEGLPW